MTLKDNSLIKGTELIHRFKNGEAFLKGYYAVKDILREQNIDNLEIDSVIDFIEILNAYKKDAQDILSQIEKIKSSVQS